MIKPIESIRPEPPAGPAAERRPAAPEPTPTTAAVIDLSQYAMARQSAASNGQRDADRDNVGKKEASEHDASFKDDQEAVARLIQQLIVYPPVAKAAQANTSSDRVLELIR